LECDLLGKHGYAAGIDEMKHPDEAIRRILFLCAVPNGQRLFPIAGGQTAREVPECDRRPK
jgi:bacterioferritin (cytochrome b1)